MARALMRFLHRHRRTIARVGIFGGSLCILLAGLFILWVANLKIPDFSNFDERQITQSTKIYDRTGQVLLYDIGENLRRTVVTSDEISYLAKNAAVAIEDSEFYEHSGVKPTAIIRAAWANFQIAIGISDGYTQGGSTITQQVVKNGLLTNERKLSRKLKEAFLALKLERVLTKDEILTHYLNESPYGGNVYGIEEATQTFFGKPAANLTLAEAAYLAALPQAPTYYSPYGDHKDALEARKNLVLKRMRDLDFITEEEETAAKAETVAFLPVQNFGIKAPHFVMYVRAYLEEKYGKEEVQQGGLKVITTLDWEMQKKAEAIVADFAPINEKNYNAHNAAIVATDPHNGEIRIMIGSRDYFEDGSGNFNVALAHRQPGSSFKPYVYATAFKEGYTPDTVLFDLPTQFQTTCSPLVTEGEGPGCYSPVNYDGLFRGPMTMRAALAQSINIPAIETLYLAGIKDSLATAKSMGITSLGNANQYGLTLVLGGGEVSLLEHTNAYGVFADGGLYRPSSAILKISDSQGNVLEEALPIAPGERVMDEVIASTISDILSDNVARAPSYGSDSPLATSDRDFAAKTGTTNDYRDMWVIGYSPEITLGAWVGNNDNSSMEKKVAGFVVAPMWRKIFDAISTDLPRTSFVRPEYPYKSDPTGIKPILRGVWQGGETYTVDKQSGKLATEFTPAESKSEQAVTDVHSILHWVSKDNPNGPAPINPANDPQYVYWETPVRVWAASHGYAAGSTVAPTESDNVHSPEQAPVVSISSPIEAGSYPSGGRMTVNFVISKNSFPIDKTEIYLNGVFVGSVKYPTTTYSFVPSSISGIQSTNELEVAVYDDQGNRGSSKVRFSVAN